MPVDCQVDFSTFTNAMTFKSLQARKFQRKTFLLSPTVLEMTYTIQVHLRTGTYTICTQTHFPQGGYLYHTKLGLKCLMQTV